MAAKTKSGKPQKNILVSKEREAPARKAWFASGSLWPFILISLYLLVEIIPRMGAADVMGPQWLYLASLNVIGPFNLGFNPSIRSSLVSQIGKNALSLLFLALFLLAGLSFLTVLNRSEFLVTYSRFIITLVAFFVMAMTLRDKFEILVPLAVVLGLVLFFQSLGVLSQFFSQVGEKSVNEIIFNLKGNSGNKNILAVGLAIKIPFVFYCLFHFRNWFRLFFLTCITLGATALFLVNARASFLALLFQVFIFLAYQVLLYVKTKNLKQSLTGAGLILGPVLLAIGFSTVVLNNAIANDPNTAAYGSVAERLGSISLTEQGSTGRLQQWRSAVDYIQHHPLKGCGYGNWKLASIPYEREYVDDFLVTYHVHNDFLELTAELGWAGGLLYLAIFACTAFFLLSALFSSSGRVEKNGVVLLLALLGTYVNDAMFNFPVERPVMQAFLAFILAASVQVHISRRNRQAAGSEKPWIKKAFAGISLVLLLPAIYVSAMTYQSLCAQYKFNDDMLQEKPVNTFDAVNRDLPSFPDMNAFCFPIGAIKARYLENEKRYSEALELLRSSDDVNPLLSLNPFLKGRIYLAMNKVDSAFYYARQAFDLRPRSMANFKLLGKTAFMRKDTAALTHAFREFSSRRKEAGAWKEYISYLSILTRDPAVVAPILDSARKLFPADQELPKFAANNLLSDEAQELFNKGLTEFNQKQYLPAIRDFTKVTELNPASYTSYENIGMSYFALNRFSEAIPFFERVIKLNIATDGKSEFFLALSLSQLNRNREACPYLQQALKKGYNQAGAYMATICK